MDLSSMQFLTWSFVVFVCGMAAGIGAAAVWAFRAMCSADVQDTISGGAVMDDSQLDLHAALTHATDRLICSARTLAYWVADDDDLPAGAEVPSEEDAARACWDTYEAIAQIQFARLEIAGQMALFDEQGIV